MGLQNKIIFFAFLFIAFVSGITLDRFFQDFPYLKLDPQINILSLASLIVTIVIAFLIPISITKLIEDKRGIKAFLVDEFKELIIILNKIKTIIVDAHGKGIFETHDRDNINYIFHEAELKTSSIREQIKEAFGEKVEETNKNLTDLLFSYKDYITGGELMNSSFTKVEDRFYRESNTEYSKIETGLKTEIQKIQKC
jgi:hypothetical protein